MLRAAYVQTPPTTTISKLTIPQFGQELLSTFGTQIGEIALIPATGGLFQVELVHLPLHDTISTTKVT
jgi:hypothetical protein